MPDRPRQAPRGDDPRLLLRRLRRAERGVCIYLDGLSEHIHGNETTRRRDMAIRQQLRNRPFMVVLEIACTDLRDRNAMQRHFFDLGKALSLDKSKLRELREDPRWFVHEGEPT